MLGGQGGVERPEAGLYHGSHLGDAVEVLGRLGGGQQGFEDTVIHSGAKASVIVVSLAGDDGKVQEAEGEGAEVLLVLVGKVFLFLHVPFQGQQAVTMVVNNKLQASNLFLHFAYRGS